MQACEGPFRLAGAPTRAVPARPQQSGHLGRAGGQELHEKGQDHADQG